MSTRNKILDSVTVTNGETVTTDDVELRDQQTLSIQVEGDTDTDDLGLEIEGKVDSIDEWSFFDSLSLAFNKADSDDTLSYDYVSNTGNLIIPYDVLDLERFRIKITNNGALNTVLSVVTSNTDYE